MGCRQKNSEGEKQAYQNDGDRRMSFLQKSKLANQSSSSLGNSTMIPIGGGVTCDTPQHCPELKFVQGQCEEDSDWSVHLLMELTRKEN